MCLCEYLFVVFKSVLNFADSVWLRVCSELYQCGCGICVYRVFVWVCIRSCKTLFLVIYHNFIVLFSWTSLRFYRDRQHIWHLEANKVLFLTILAWNFGFIFLHFLFFNVFLNFNWNFWNRIGIFSFFSVFFLIFQWGYMGFPIKLDSVQLNKVPCHNFSNLLNIFIIIFDFTEREIDF